MTGDGIDEFNHRVPQISISNWPDKTRQVHAFVSVMSKPNVLAKPWTVEICHADLLPFLVTNLPAVAACRHPGPHYARPGHPASILHISVPSGLRAALAG
jgi:hypothetical protein